MCFRDFIEKTRNKSYQVKTSFEDWFFLALGILLCIVGSPSLRLVTGIMSIWMLWEEVVQLITLGFAYLKSKENVLDLVMLSLVLPMLFLPDV